MPKINSYITAATPPTPPQTSTNVPLAAGAEWSSVAFPAGNLSFLTGSVFANQAGQLWIEQSNNKQNWDVQTEYDVPANDGKGFKEDLLLEWVRVRYVNGSTGQQSFRLYFLLK
jgi:hypothetical protein